MSRFNRLFIMFVKLPRAGLIGIPVALNPLRADRIGPYILSKKQAPRADGIGFFCAVCFTLIFVKLILLYRLRAIFRGFSVYNVQTILLGIAHIPVFIKYMPK